MSYIRGDAINPVGRFFKVDVRAGGLSVADVAMVLVQKTPYRIALLDDLGVKGGVKLSNLVVPVNRLKQQDCSNCCQSHVNVPQKSLAPHAMIDHSTQPYRG